MSALLATTNAWASDPDVTSKASTRDRLKELQQQTQALELGDRMQRISTPLMGLPYQSDPLGEGSGPDPDPVVRFDAFDCLTFVEEVLAWSLSDTGEEADQLRISLRYQDDLVNYPSRRHFMELQWLPDNVEHGFLKDITHSLGDGRTLKMSVTPQTWQHWKTRQRFHHTDEQLPTGEMSLNIIDLDTALQQVANIPPGTLLLTVREPSPGVPIWTTHLGFVLPGTPAMVRHATRMKGRRTMDHDLTWYLNHLKTYTNWPVAGVALFQPIRQSSSPTNSAITRPVTPQDTNQ